MNDEKYLWKPVDDLPEDYGGLRSEQTEALVGAWRSRAEELRETRVYNEFLLRLRRQWAIETGVLERLYSLSDGVTKTLIEKGFDAAIIGRDDTDRDPTDVLTIIEDQFAVVDGLYQFVSGQRPLGTSYVKELHRALTEHQVAYEARDTLGRSVQPTLPRGEWKKLPNNVIGPGDYTFEFCPPEQVESEMDRLLEMHHVHGNRHVPPYIEAAWLHHRFTLIHPFADGNGRVARCLATLVLLRAEWFPLVVTRSDRQEYIAALRQADKGDLRGLVDLFAALQSKAVREAFSLTEELDHEQAAIGGILSAVKDRLSRLRREMASKKRQVLAIADALHSLATTRLKDLAEEVNAAISAEEEKFSAFCSSAPRTDTRANYHYYQIIQCARSLGYYANLQVYQSWTNLVIQANTRAEILFSFHGMGKGATGVIACSAMFYTKESGDTGETVIGEVTPLCSEPFTFTHDEEPKDVERRFVSWVHERLVSGLDHWRKGLGA